MFIRLFHSDEFLTFCTTITDYFHCYRLCDEWLKSFLKWKLKILKKLGKVLRKRMTGHFRIWGKAQQIPLSSIWLYPQTSDSPGRGGKWTETTQSGMTTAKALLYIPEPVGLPLEHAWLKAQGLVSAPHLIKGGGGAAPTCGIPSSCWNVI